MITRKLFLVFSLFFVFLGTGLLKSQVSGYAIVLNEYNVSNVPGTGQPDDKGFFSDYVEIYNNFGSKVSLSGYYLSNDINNLYKWKFPSNFVMNPGDYQVVWLSGRGTASGVPNDGQNFHANFTIEQCKNQSIILTSPTGVIYDQVKVMPTKTGHVWGRNTDYTTGGQNAWQLYPNKSPKSINGNPVAKNYAPTPKFFVTTATNPNYTASINAGGFGESATPPMIFIKHEGVTYDSLYSCYDIFYTMNGDYPVPFYNGSTTNGNYYRYIDSTTSLITLANTTMLRAIAIPKQSTACSNLQMLESFCETNTYFQDKEHTEFDENFGVISISMESTLRSDTGWFNNSAAPTISVHVEYYDNKKQVSEGYAMLQKPVQESWRTKQKGFYIAKDDRLGFGCNFEGPIFNVEGLGVTSRTVFPQLHLHAGDLESNSTEDFAPGTVMAQGTGIRDVLMQSLAAKNNLHVNPLHIKPVVAFVNGKYWGVYDLREIYDKYYENYYHKQAVDSMDLNFVHGGTIGVEGRVSYWDGPGLSMNGNFGSEVYQVTKNNSMAGPKYNDVLKALDKESFIDYMILNSYAMNSDLWSHNVSVAKGANKTKEGGKWHFYLWNMPSIFNFTVISNNNKPIANPNTPICYFEKYTNYALTPFELNAHGLIFDRLMADNVGSSQFRLEYKNRFQDLLNGPLKCENILKHFDYIYKLYSKEMKYHESDASTPYKGRFSTSDLNRWDTLMLAKTSGLRDLIGLRCYVAENGFKGNVCYNAVGPFDLIVDVRPAGTGNVKINSLIPDTYPWYGKYYSTQMTFQAIPIDTNYVFHHWELSNINVGSGQSLTNDSITANFNISTNVLAVFTDKRTGISNGGEYVNIPTGFSPNADGLNDEFKPVVDYDFDKEYQMTIWNRWGQEVFRSTSVKDGWDGRYKGQEAQTGVYAYLITYRDMSNKEKVVKGNVTLTR